MRNIVGSSHFSGIAMTIDDLRKCLSLLEAADALLEEVGHGELAAHLSLVIAGVRQELARQDVHVRALDGAAL
jgi:hypothetical protein